MHKEVENNKSPNKNILLIIISICITAIIIFAIYRLTGTGGSNGSSNTPSSEQSKITADCPYECCNEGNYLAKECGQDYGCVNTKCVAIDSDRDGLTDIEEKALGTNPNLYDSDGDTLGDYQEVKVLHTNPLNSNTDGDRYKDNDDLEPTVKNTAEITVDVMSKEFNIQWVNLGIAIGTAGVGAILSPSMVIAKPTISLSIANQGTDYSYYLSYDIVVYVSGEELKRVHQTAGKIDEGYSNNLVSNFEIKAEDVTNILISAITNKNTQWDAKIENIDYEKF